MLGLPGAVIPVVTGQTMPLLNLYNLQFPTVSLCLLIVAACVNRERMLCLSCGVQSALTHRLVKLAHSINDYTAHTAMLCDKSLCSD